MWVTFDLLDVPNTSVFVAWKKPFFLLSPSHTAFGKKTSYSSTIQKTSVNAYKNNSSPELAGL